jgi:hypothetical protein
MKTVLLSGVLWLQKGMKCKSIRNIFGYSVERYGPWVCRKKLGVNKDPSGSKIGGLVLENGPEKGIKAQKRSVDFSILVKVSNKLRHCRLALHTTGN